MTDHRVAMDPADRAPHLRRGLRLDNLTVGRDIVEGIIAVTAALAARSVVLLGFGIDRIVATFSGFILIGRVTAEIERRARQLVGLSRFLLAANVATITMTMRHAHLAHGGGAELIKAVEAPQSRLVRREEGNASEAVEEAAGVPAG